MADAPGDRDLRRSSAFPAPDPRQFLATGVFGDPTLRTPGSEIPEALYAASDAEPFDLRDSNSLPVAPASLDNPLLALLITLLLLAVIAATAIYLYRDTHAPHSGLPFPQRNSRSSSRLNRILPAASLASFQPSEMHQKSVTI